MKARKRRPIESIAKPDKLIGMMRPCQAAVMGDVTLARQVKGSTDRISPEAPIPILPA